VQFTYSNGLYGYSVSEDQPQSVIATEYHLLTVEDDLLGVGGAIEDLASVGAKLADLFS
jgi:hypothetical protein